jgi:hypothetical protein
MSSFFGDTESGNLPSEIAASRAIVSVSSIQRTAAKPVLPVSAELTASALPWKPLSSHFQRGFSAELWNVNITRRREVPSACASQK